MRPSVAKIVQDLEILILRPEYEVYKNPIVFSDDGNKKIKVHTGGCEQY
jgi:hypothetical protein